MKQELKTCAHCGHKATKSMYGIRCTNQKCGCAIESEMWGYDELIERWNTRHEHTEHNLEMMQELTTEIDFWQEKLEICKYVLPAIYTELYREMKKKSPQIARDYEENIEKWSVNQAIALANELISKLKQQSDERN